MATVIRFSRHGTKKRPFYRIVVQNHTAPRDGRFIEHIGHYDPLKDAILVERDRLEYWESTGAQVSTSVKNRLRNVRKQWLAGTEGEAKAPAPVPNHPQAVSGEKAPKPKKAKKEDAPKEA